MIDESFYSLNEIIANATDINGELINTEDGVHSYIYEMEIETPVELDIIVDEHGKVVIGTIPPMYRVDTTFKPSYHSLRIVAEKSDL
jgi:hypothetical protein